MSGSARGVRSNAHSYRNFWHNHFTSSLNKVRWPHLLYHQNALFRRLATGNFAELLRAVARDRAMLLYLDSQTNRVGQANENFARELLELFTLGEGQGYTERDIREAARAFTGWMVNPGTGEFTVARRFHDTGSKTFLGRTGRFDGDDIIDIVLDQPRIAEHICEKLWRAFVSDTPDAGAVRRLAAVFRGSGYELRPTLRALFLSAEFRAPANRGVLTKSPVDVVAGTLRFMDALDMDRKKGCGCCGPWARTSSIRPTSRGGRGEALGSRPKRSRCATSSWAGSRAASRWR